MGNNPAFQRAEQMMQGRSPEEMQQVVKNVCSEQGLDFNQITGMLKNIGIKL